MHRISVVPGAIVTEKAWVLSSVNVPLSQFGLA